MKFRQETQLENKMEEMITDTENKKSHKLSLTMKIFIGLILGALTGFAMYYVVPQGWVRDTLLINGVFYVVGTGFLRLMQMLVVPLVFCSIVVGTMSMGDIKKMGRIGVKSILFYLGTTAIAITLSLAIGAVFQPGKGLDISTIEKVEVNIAPSTSVTETLLNIIPTNPFAALMEGNMLQIILFALMFGIALAQLGEKTKLVSNFFSQSNEIMMKLTEFVMKAAPYGVFCMIARTFSQIGLDGVMSLLKYIVAVLVGLGIHCFIVYLLALKGMTGLSPRKFMKKFFPVMGFAFSTASSNATIPYNIEVLEEKLGVSKEIASFTIPLGATINMDGTAIMQGVAVMFAAQAFGITLTPQMIATVVLTATLASIGTAGAPGVGMITLSMVFASVGLPVEAITMIMGVDRIVDMARTAVNITGDAVCTTIIAHQEKQIDLDQYQLAE